MILYIVYIYYILCKIIMTEILEENKKIIWNAVSAYLLLFISILFLFQKNNKYLNNYFVASHTKVAFLIHLWFLITLIIFNILWLLNNINFLWYTLNNIISSSLFILLFFMLLLGIYKASSWKKFILWEISIINGTTSLINITWNSKLNEKDKLTILLSYIPFIWFIVLWNYYKKDIINSISKFNLFITTIIIIIYILWYYNIANLFSLLYIIFIVFVWINIFVNNKIVSFNLPFLLSPEESFNFLINIKKYLKNYFNEETFIPIKQIIKEREQIRNNIENENEKLLETKKDIRVKKWLFYIPFINLIFLFFMKSKYHFHIINWIYLSCFIIIAIILDFFGYFNSILYILFLFPIFYWIWYIESRPAYKMPFVYICYEGDMWWLKLIKSIFSKTNKIRKTEEKISLKPKNLEK